VIGVDQVSFLVVVLAATVAALTVAVLPRGKAPPVVVIELVLGIVIGPQVLGLADSDDFIEFFSNLGLGMLFFFAGYEIEFDRIRGRPLRLGATGWAFSLALAYGLGGILAAAGVVISLLYTGSALATTAIGTLIPILRDTGDLRTRFGTYLLAAGAVGEFGPIMLFTLVLSTTHPVHEAAILIAFVAMAVLLALFSVRVGLRGIPVLEQTLEASSQLAVRIAVLLIFGLAALAGELGLDVLLGGFVAGMITRTALRGGEMKALRVEVDRCRLRLPRAVLLRLQRHQLRSRCALRERRRAAEGAALPRSLPGRARGAGAAPLPRRPGRPRARGAGVLLRHRIATRGRDHDRGAGRRTHELVHRRRAGGGGDPLDPDLPARRAQRAQERRPAEPGGFGGGRKVLARQRD
jgi:Sodium/hydrogen exchanger family